VPAKKQNHWQRAHENLLGGGFTGTLLPVNPKHKTINGQHASNQFPPGDGVDLAIIATPIQSVAEL